MANKQVLPILRVGFRPFFLLAGVASLVLMFVWGGLTAHGIFPQNYYNPVNWHAHEMLYGYAVAVFSGFLLTAVKNWTGRTTAEGVKLAVLASIWLLGRIVVFFDDVLPHELIATVDLAFLPCLIGYLVVPIWQQRMFKNLPVIFLLSCFFGANLAFHLGVLNIITVNGSQLMQFVVGVMLVFIGLIAGRVFPFFIRAGSKGCQPVTWRFIEWLSMLSLLVLLVLKPFYYGSMGFLVVSVIAMASHTIRLTGWFSVKALKVPLIGVLFAGYGWLIVGISLDFLAALNLVSPLLATHAMTAGAIGVLTLGMMSRVSLGHTGRTIQAPKVITAAFVILNIAVFFRVIVPLVDPLNYMRWLNVASGLWVLAFLLFTSYFAPILLRRRVDEDS